MTGSQPATVQSFGAIVILSSDLAVVHHCSESTAEVLGVPPTDLLGQTPPRELQDLLTQQDPDRLLTSLRRYIGRTALQEIPVDVGAYRNTDELIVVECEPVSGTTSAVATKALHWLNQTLAVLDNTGSTEEVGTVTCEALFHLTQFQYVALFHHIESPAPYMLVKTSKHADEKNFDAIAKKLCADAARNPERALSYIADADAQRSAILSATPQTPPLDLYVTHLQGHDQDICDAIRAAGLRSALSLQLSIDGQPWGTIVCLHDKPAHLAPDVRSAAETLTRAAALHIKQQEDLATTQYRRRASTARSRIQARAKDADSLWAQFPSLAGQFQDIVPSDGLALRLGDQVKTFGSVPPQGTVRTLALTLPNAHDVVAHTTGLAERPTPESAGMGQTAGALVVRSSTQGSLVDILFFRDQIDRDTTNHPPSCLPWDSANRAMARVLQAYLNQIHRKGRAAPAPTPRDAADHQRQQELKLAEMNHRMKNTLALIRSLSRQAKASSESIEDYTAALEKRIAALSSAQDLALNEPSEGLSLRSLIERGLAPHEDAAKRQTALSGPVIGLNPTAAPLLVLVLHEVITNAAKHGALSSPDGIVRARWSVTDTALRFEWHEIGATPISPPQRTGFGHMLIEKAIPFELDGKTDLTFEATGLTFTFELPKEHLTQITAETGQPRRTAKENSPTTAGRTALLVEDNMLLAMDLSQTLTRLGAGKVRTASSLKDGMELARSGYIDFAVIDVSLRGEPCFPIADRLKARGIPFVFVSGYNSNVEMLAAHRDVPLLSKPVDEALLSRTLHQILS